MFYRRLTVLYYLIQPLEVFLICKNESYKCHFKKPSEAEEFLFAVCHDGIAQSYLRCDFFAPGSWSAYNHDIFPFSTMMRLGTQQAEAPLRTCQGGLHVGVMFTREASGNVPSSNHK